MTYEADAQLAKLRTDGAIDLVYSAAQDSDFLVYHGMGEIIYTICATTAHSRPSTLSATCSARSSASSTSHTGQESTFRVWSASCGCDYVENPPKVGAVKLYQLIHSSHCALDESALINLVAVEVRGCS